MYVINIVKISNTVWIFSILDCSCCIYVSPWDGAKICRTVTLTILNTEGNHKFLPTSKQKYNKTIELDLGNA